MDYSSLTQDKVVPFPPNLTSSVTPDPQIWNFLMGMEEPELGHHYDKSREWKLAFLWGHHQRAALFGTNAGFLRQ